MNYLKVRYQRLALFCYQITHLTFSQWDIEKLHKNALGSYRQQNQ